MYFSHFKRVHVLRIGDVFRAQGFHIGALSGACLDISIPPCKSQLRMQSMTSSLFIPAGLAGGGENIEQHRRRPTASATMNGENEEFP